MSLFIPGSQSQWQVFIVSVAAVPWIYMVPTLALIVHIHSTYRKFKEGPRSNQLINRHLFLVLCLSQYMSFAFFLLDYFLIRLPFTGAIGELCCRNVSPNHFLGVFLFTTFYFNYLSMTLPLLWPLIRLLIAYFPNTHFEMTGTILRFAFLFICLHPIWFTYCIMFARGGFQTSLNSFGDVGMFYIIREMSDQYDSFLWNTAFWLLCSIVLTLALLRKMNKRGIVPAQQSSQSHRAQFSISVTTVAILSIYIVNSVLRFASAFCEAPISYEITDAPLFRPFGNDIQTVAIPFVFYLTHPIFEKEGNRIFGWTYERRVSDASRISPAPSAVNSF